MLKIIKNKLTSLIQNYYRKKAIGQKVKVVIYGHDTEKEHAVLSRLSFFLDLYAIPYEKEYNPKRFPLFSRNIKLFIGHTTPQNFAKQSFLSFNIDPSTNPQDGWEYHKILSILYPITPIEQEKSKEKLAKAISNCNKRNLSNVYLFGTGSSLEQAIERKWDDGYKIVCNTIVKDAALWNYLQPDFIVAADAIYHYGDNLFAKAFCNDLHKRLTETTNTYFVYPSIFHPFVSKKFSEFYERLIPIPLGRHTNITNNFSKRFELPALGNVLNNMLLPLGMNISKKIFLWGFNGRAPNDKDFWKNSDKHFYTDLVDDIKTKHPYFYEYYVPKGKEDKYVKKYHGDELDNSLTDAESKGWIITMLHPTYTPALQKRYKKNLND